MSGGSFDYLYTCDPEDLLNREQDIFEMIKTLEDLGYPEQAKETKNLLTEIQVFHKSFENRLNRLKDVWQAVEFYISKDWGKESIDTAISNSKETEECTHDAIEITADDAFTLFNSLIVREVSIFKKANEDRLILLRKLWNYSPIRRKEEALWNSKFREHMDKIGFSYEADLIELGIPKELETDSE